jgi:hypothetical protein
MLRIGNHDGVGGGNHGSGPGDTPARRVLLRYSRSTSAVDAMLDMAVMAASLVMFQV